MELAASLAKLLGCLPTPEGIGDSIAALVAFRRNVAKEMESLAGAEGDDATLLLTVKEASEFRGEVCDLMGLDAEDDNEALMVEVEDRIETSEVVAAAEAMRRAFDMSEMEWRLIAAHPIPEWAARRELKAKRAQTQISDATSSIGRQVLQATLFAVGKVKTSLESDCDE